MTEVIIDFEGCRQKGIRQIGIVQSTDLHITNTWDVDIVDQKDVPQILMEALKDVPTVLIAHNAHVEKNLLRKYLPYRHHNEKSNKLNLSWGPWIDTKEVYASLYPKIKNYTLENLTNAFFNKQEVKKRTNKYCVTEKRKPHFALYDAICTYMLIRRLCNLVDLGKFTKD
jgi:DNA polymerase III alpha subunit (gram-positive type)